MSMWNPDVTVAAIVERDGRFLMVEEVAKSSGSIVFNQPAGHLEDGESILDAVVRETREETCRHFTPSGLLGLYRVRAVNGKTYIRYAFVGDVSEHDSSLILDPDILRTHWFTAEDIFANPALRGPLVSQCINDYLAGQRYPLDVVREL